MQLYLSVHGFLENESILHNQSPGILIKCWDVLSDIEMHCWWIILSLSLVWVSISNLDVNYYVEVVLKFLS